MSDDIKGEPEHPVIVDEFARFKNPPRFTGEIDPPWRVDFVNEMKARSSERPSESSEDE